MSNSAFIGGGVQDVEGVNADYYTFCILFTFNARSQNCEKRLVASSYLSVCLSVRPFGTTPFLGIFLTVHDELTVY